jgi:hypothetical protein
MADHGNAVLNVVPVAAIRVRNAVAIPHVDHAASTAPGAVVVAGVGHVRVGVGMRRCGECQASGHRCGDCGERCSHHH